MVQRREGIRPERRSMGFGGHFVFRGIVPSVVKGWLLENLYIITPWSEQNSKTYSFEDKNSIKLTRR